MVISSSTRFRSSGCINNEFLSEINKMSILNAKMCKSTKRHSIGIFKHRIKYLFSSSSIKVFLTYGFNKRWWDLTTL